MEDMVGSIAFGNTTGLNTFKPTTFTAKSSEKQNFEEEKFYYYFFRDSMNRPMVTACIIAGPNGIGRGISVCSNGDNPEKKIGKEIAKRRALKAYWEKRNGDRIKCEYSKKIIESTNYFKDRKRNNKGELKMEYNPQLTKHEKRIIYREK
jgi:hypothetical protein